MRKSLQTLQRQNKENTLLIVTDKVGTEAKQHEQYLIQKYSFMLAYIPTGKVNAITEKKLSSYIHCTVRELQRQLNNARNEGVLIVTDNKGVYLPSNIEDIRSCYLINYARMKSIQKMLKHFKKILKDYS